MPSLVIVYSFDSFFDCFPLLAGKWPENLVLLFGCLEATVSVLGGGVDELNVNLLGHPGLGSCEDRFSKHNWSLSGSHDTTLKEDEVFVDLSVVRESTEWGDVLLNGISFAHGVVGGATDLSSTDTVDFVVKLSSGMVTQLTTTGDSPFDCRWMPSSDTSDLADTSVGASLETSNSESLDNTLGTFTSGNTNGIDALGHLEDFRDSDLLLEFGESPVDLVGDGSTVNLNLHDVCLELAEVEFVNLGGADDTDGRAVFLNTLKISLDGLGVLVFMLEAVDVLLEGVLLGSVPVLVESSLNILVDVLGPDSGEGTESTWGLNVSDHTDDLHWWALNNRGSMHNILLDDLLTFSTLLVLDTMGHASLVAHEGSEMNWLCLVILWPMSDTASVMLGSSLWEVGKRTLPWVLKLSMGHSVLTLIFNNDNITILTLLIFDQQND